MNNIQLFLNEQLCDLTDDSPIALTFMINNLADVKNQAGNTSNQFKLPLTQNNRRILGFPDDIRITTDIPYTQLNARIIQDGIEIVPYGLAGIQSCDQNSCDITIVSGNVDFFEIIDGKLYDMGDSTTTYGASKPFAPYNHIWNLNNAMNSRKNTEGYIYPVIDYGALDNKVPYEIDVRNLRPAFFVKTAVDLIVKSAGYKSGGSLLADPLYSQMIVPFANDNFEHGQDYQQQPDELGLLATSNADQSREQILFGVGNIGNLRFDLINSDPNNQFNGEKFTANTIFSATILITIPKFYFMGKLQDNYLSSVDIQIYLHTPSEGELVIASYNYDLSGGFTRVPGTSGGNLRGYTTINDVKISGDVDFKIGYQVYCRYQFYNARPESFTMYAGATLSIKAQNQKVLFGQEVQCERIFPDISQKDFLKDTLQRFGIICQTDNTSKTVTFASFKDIVRNIPNAKDWTLKCVNQGQQNTFSLGSYAQINYLKYKTDDAITDGYADDNIPVNNKNLQANIDLFTSQFAPSLNSPYIGGYTAQILKIDPTQEGTEFTISTSPRILVDNKVNLFNVGGGVTVDYVDGVGRITVNDVISCPYFYKNNGAFSLMWSDQGSQKGLRTLYYRELERILKNTKKTVRYFLLTPRDIAELDLLIPVYLEQDNAYFYINKIDSWIKGQAVKVELVKLGEI